MKNLCENQEIDNTGDLVISSNKFLKQISINDPIILQGFIDIGSSESKLNKLWLTNHSILKLSVTNNYGMFLVTMLFLYYTLYL